MPRSVTQSAFRVQRCRFLRSVESQRFSLEFAVVVPQPRCRCLGAMPAATGPMGCCGVCIASKVTDVPMRVCQGNNSSTNLREPTAGADAKLMLQSLHAGGPATCLSACKSEDLFCIATCGPLVSPRRAAPRTWTSADRFTSITAVTDGHPVKERIFRLKRRAPGS